MVFTTEGFLEVAIESWPEWDLNPRPLNSVQNCANAIIQVRTFGQVQSFCAVNHFM